MFRSYAFAAAALFVVVVSADAFALELVDCRISAGESFPSMRARCGHLERPENPAEPDGPKIDIRVVVVPALNLDPENDPIVPLAGGPGQGAVQFYAAYAHAFEPVRRDRDILLVDQRGTGASARLDCAVDEELIEGQLSAEQTRQLTEECLESLPHDPRYFTTSIAITDLEAARQALGYASLNLYGVSYGSRVAQHFARRFPQSTRTIVLDGVVPPQLALGPGIAVEAQRALERIFERCENDADCSARFPRLADNFDDLLARLDKKAVSVKLADPVTGKFDQVRFGRAELAAAVRLLAYRPNTVAMLPLLISEADGGNYKPLAAQFVMTLKSLSDALAIGMHNAVVCSEDAPFFASEIEDDAVIAATYMGTMQVEALKTICSIWPAGPVDEDFKEPLSTEIPALLLSGSADPITPPAFADLAATKLRKAWLLVGENQGHGQLAVGCMPRIFDRFVRNRMLDLNADAACFRASFVMPFFLDYAGPTP